MVLRGDKRVLNQTPSADDVIPIGELLVDAAVHSIAVVERGRQAGAVVVDETVIVLILDNAIDEQVLVFFRLQLTELEFGEEGT